MENTVTLYAKKFGCPQCDMTKRRFDKAGVLDKVNIVYIDQPENADVLESLKSQGLASAPIVMVSTPVSVNGSWTDTWTGFNPNAVDQAIDLLK